VPIVLLLLAVVGVCAAGCRAPDTYEPERAALADPVRGERLFKSNCARSCHPSNAFEVQSVRDHRQLINTVRAYYEQVVGDEMNYARQEVYDLARYLDRKHYRLPAVVPQEAPTQP
jgi:mono/diheme cytochrome c family protein